MFPFPQGLGPYNVSKTALLGLGKNLAIELAQSNIRVNCLAPGIIKTNFSQVVRRGCPASCWESWRRGPELPITPAPLPSFSVAPLRASHLARPDPFFLPPGVRWTLRSSDSAHAVPYPLKWVGMGRASEMPHWDLKRMKRKRAVGRGWGLGRTRKWKRASLHPSSPAMCGWAVPPCWSPLSSFT